MKIMKFVVTEKS